MAKPLLGTSWYRTIQSTGKEITASNFRSRTHQRIEAGYRHDTGLEDPPPMERPIRSSNARRKVRQTSRFVERSGSKWAHRPTATFSSLISATDADPRLGH